MGIETINVEELIRMFRQGADNLKAHAAAINALNVFPVPDGDTGTNMALTIASGVRELQRPKELQTIGDVVTRFAKGLLMGARGNSGVILSQLFRGFSQVLKNEGATVDAKTLAQAFQAGVDTAYKAVMKPVEGTILTVAREAAKAGVTCSAKQPDCFVMLKAITDQAKETLQKTPDMLPLLKEVGVVDSGGQGLLVIYQGFLSVLSGEAPPSVGQEETLKLDDMVRAEHHKNNHSFMKTEDIAYGFCTEFMVRFSEKGRHAFKTSSFRQTLSNYGDSLLVVSDEELLKVHIHSERPGEVLNIAQDYGEMIKIKIENMREQHAEMIHSDLQQDSEQEDDHVEKTKVTFSTKFAVIAVVPSSGIAEMFKSLGATAVVEGGQSMNPSTEDLIQAIEQTGAKQVLVLPNNGNIIMAAKQAADVVEAEVEIIETRTIPQGLSATMVFSSERTLEENREAMKLACSGVKSGQVTTAVRNTTVDGVGIVEGNFIGLYDGTIVTTSSDRITSVVQLLEKMIDEDDEVIDLICGAETTEEEQQDLVKLIEAQFVELELTLHQGGQPLYDYLISVE